MKNIYFITIVLGVLLFVACDDSSSGKNNSSNNINNSNNTNVECDENSLTCFGNILQECKNGSWTTRTVCGANNEPPYCDSVNLQCQICFTGEPVCGEDGNLYTCSDSGELGQLIEECDLSLGNGCLGVNGSFYCDTPCGRARHEPSYRGCDFWSVTTPNSNLNTEFATNFGLAIDNSDDVDTDISISGPAVSINDTIPAHSIRLFKIPFNEELRNAGSTTGLSNFKSGIYRASEDLGAVHITTTRPVTIYQFNPYDYVLNSITSNSNDASLLLPSAVLRKYYMVMSQPSNANARMGTQYGTTPGFTTIVATKDNTVINFLSTAITAEGTDVNSLTPDASGNWTLNKGDVLQIVSKTDFNVDSCPANGEVSGPDGDMFEYCSGGDDYDLTGSVITSSKPIMVIAGHNCANVPFDTRACDHLEEVLFPVETWGTHFFVGLTHPVEELTSETNVIKILSGSLTENHVTFKPVSAGGLNDITLMPGEYYEFLAPVGAHYEINSDGPLLVGKFTVGQKMWTDQQGSSGDPAFGLVIPVEQYRGEYSFTAPESMTVNYVNVISKIPDVTGPFIVLDGTEITNDMYEEISSGYGVARIDITTWGVNGSHHIESSDGILFGIEVYGFANYTSYLYPGGLDLKLINPIE